jgi:extracellular elastinolytic metalloproteinase
LSAEPITVKPVYYLQNNELHLAWAVVINSMTLDNNWWQGWVDAENAKVLAVENWVNDATYRVFEFPKEAPVDGPDTLALNPEDAVASPLGWHDDGAIQFTDTRGNNVLAQEDTDNNNSGGRRPDGGASLNFDFPLDLATQAPPAYLDFAITNLFYWNNIVHDVLYQYGFDEASGNFQTNNFGLGGNGNDAVRADAQDGSDTNNANFGTPPDGSAPRMQMFVWTDGTPAVLRIDSPASIAADYVAAPAGFGQVIDITGISGTLELVSDGSANPTLGCGVLTGFTAGNIAVVDRGTCEFGAKGVNAEAAGAIGMIVVNNAAGNDTIPMGAGAQGGSVRIPSAMIGNDDGLIIRAELGGVVTGSLFKPDGISLDRDSDLDAGVIAHEYGHGVSNRLTGGPGNTSCLFGDEQQGEGWSDYLALVFTHEDGDTADTARGVGRYLIFQEDNPAAGIRPFPYTRDMSVNPLTYADIINAGQAGSPISIPHGVGTVWNTMLWDMYWNLVDKHGYDADLYNGTGGNNIALQTVLDGMKMQPCGPTFVTSRDAILDADEVNNGGANQCEIWQAFARRGVGVSASDGGGPDMLDVTEAFDLPPQCALQEVFLIDGFEDPAPL